MENNAQESIVKMIDLLDFFDTFLKGLKNKITTFEEAFKSLQEPEAIPITEKVFLVLNKDNTSFVEQLKGLQIKKTISLSEKKIFRIKLAIKNLVDFAILPIPFQIYFGALKIRFRRVSKSYEFWSNLRRAVIEGQNFFEFNLPDFNDQEAQIFSKALMKLHKRGAIIKIESHEKNTIKLEINQCEYLREYFRVWIFFLEIIRDIYNFAKNSTSVVLLNNLEFNVNGLNKKIDLICDVDGNRYGFVLDFDSQITQRILMQKYYSLADNVGIDKSRFFFIFPNMKECSAIALSGFMNSPVLCGENYYEQFFLIYNKLNE